MAILPLSTRAVSQFLPLLFFTSQNTLRVLKAVPNVAHYVLARLAFPEVRYNVAPDSQLTHVTQNVDGLQNRALEEMTASYGTSKSPSELIEMHGRLFDVVCSAHDCSFRETNYRSPICSALAGTEQIVGDGVTDPVVRRADLPHCPLCGQLCRPGVVWFGERPHRIHDIFDLADTADLCIIVGTSGTVRTLFLHRLLFVLKDRPGIGPAGVQAGRASKGQWRSSRSV